MDYSSQHGLSRFTGRKMMIFLYVLLICNATTQSTAILTEGQVEPAKLPSTEATKSEKTKREEPEAQRREHSFNNDGSVNYHGSGSGHDSGDLVPPPGGGVFNSPSIELAVEHTGASGPGLSNSYGVPIPADSYGPPKGAFGPPSIGPPSGGYFPPSSNSPKPPRPVYGPPKPQFRPPKPVYGPPVPQFTPPKQSYGPPKPIRTKPFGSRPRPVYGPPKPSFGSNGFSHGTLLSPITSVKTQYGPPKHGGSFGTPLQPSTSYGVPKHPKHLKAPPTPPDVTYDGWKPIPGLVSKPPSSYGPPDSGHSISSVEFSSHGPSHGSSSGGGGDFGGLTPPSSFGFPHPPGGTHALSFGSTSFGSSGLGIQLQPSSSYGPPKPSYGTPLKPSTSYGPPKGSFFGTSSFGLPEPSLGPSPPKPSYGVPSLSSSSFGISHGSSFGSSSGIFHGSSKPSSSYGPPKFPASFGSAKFPSVSFGSVKPPSSSYGPPKFTSISFGPPKSPSGSYGPPKPPSISFGPPKLPSSSYGPPKRPSFSYGPPKAPSGSYGPPKPPSSSYGPPQIFTTYTIPKPGISANVAPTSAYRGPVPHPLQPPSSYGPPSFDGGLYKAPLPPNALYGVPTGPESPLGVSCCGAPPADLNLQGPSSTYGAPIDLHAPVQQIPSIDISSNQFSSTGLGAAPPATYGTPLLPSAHQPPSGSYGAPTALPLRQPKQPVIFRPPVPPGLISSIGAKWGDSAWNGNAHLNKFHGDTYIPPAVPDPDPGINANQGKPLVIPPPSAPPVHYGPPTSQQHDVQTVHHIASSASGSGQISSSESGSSHISSSHSGSGENDLNPPPPIPNHGFDIQQSASVELSGSNNLDHQSGFTQTSYNAPIATSHQSVSVVSNGQSYNNVQNIPIKGKQGSYTLQIQPAGGNSGEEIPHGDVLSNGLLQDILAAIENPTASGKLEQYGGQQSNDPVASEIGLNILKQLGGDITQSSVQIPGQYGHDLSHASSNNVATFTKASDASNEVIGRAPEDVNARNVTEDQSGGKIAHYLNQNKIALYYKNQEEGLEERKSKGKDVLLVQMLLPNNSTNSESQGAEYGALVSIKLQNAQNGVERDNATVTRSYTERGDGVS